MARGRVRPAPPSGLVTLASDIGWEYASQVKGVLYSRLSPGSVVDLTHELRPHAVPEAAFLLAHMVRGFPAGTVHLVIVDPGVGGPRAPLALQCRDGSFLVGPDNGVLAPAAAELGLRRAVRLDPKKVAGGRAPSATFEGRDLFAPAAALLARGTPVEKLGRTVRPRTFALPKPRRARGAVFGELVHIDRFGNLITNIPSAWLPSGAGPMELTLSLRPPRTLPRARTYSDLPFGELGLLGSSFGLLEVARREGSAAERIGAEVGEHVELRPARPAGRR